MYNDIAQKYLDTGLNPVPLDKGDKVPNIKGWGDPISEDLSQYNFEEIGICTGSVSGGLEVIDLDLDVLDNADEVWEDWKSKIPKNILRKLVVAQTKSGGYHVFYRTSVVEGNQKLASKANKEVIMETRGQGGYVKCFPSEGYTIIFGDLADVQFLEAYERNVLITTSKLYDERIKAKKTFYADGEFNDPFPEYNNDPDIGLDVLEEHGWEVQREDKEWVYLKRPGKRRDGVSATYNIDGCFLYVFSTSTDFEAEKPYSNSAIYCILTHEGNYKKGYRELRKLGYGTDRQESKEEKTDVEDVMSYISRDGEDEVKLEQFIDGTVPLGLTFGWPGLDEYYVYKDNTVNFALAFEGIGKTLMMLNKLVSLSVQYGKRFAVCCGENDVSTVKRYILQSLTGRPINYYRHRRDELQLFKSFMNAHFFIFKNSTLHTVEQVLDIAEGIHRVTPLDGVFIDPFSYFEKPMTNENGYENRLLSVLNVYSKQVMSVFMSLHTITEAARTLVDDEGYALPPRKYHAIGGNKFANRSDAFLIYHRIDNHKNPAIRRIMNIEVQKVKDQDTGGSKTPAGESYSLAYKTFDEFTGYFDREHRNPMYEALRGGKKQDNTKPLPKLNPSDGVFD